MKRIRKIRNKVLFICLSLLLTTCQDNTLYHSFHPVEPTGWERNDTLFYTLPSIIPSSKQWIEIGIRYNGSYPYRDIWLSIRQAEEVDTVHIYLAEPNGKWKGSGIGNTRQYSEILSGVHLDTSDSIATLKVTHIMEDESLRGINDIGICLKQLP